jgi:DNA-binding LytR/AlgR family response regulator
MKVLIIEDEQAAVRRLEKLLLEVAPDTTVLDSLDSVEAAVNWFYKNAPPDLVLLDIHLADGPSFEIFNHVKLSCPIIFTTAYDEYAIQAFKVNAVDYLLKPLKVGELQAAIEKYRSIYQKNEEQNYQPLLDSIRSADAGREPIKRLLIRFSNSLKLIEIKDAAYFYTKDKITFVIMKGTAKRYPVDHPLDKLETMLDLKVFYRINRQFIINVSAIKELQPYSKSRIKVALEPDTDMEIVISTEKSADFKRWLVGEQE